MELKSLSNGIYNEKIGRYVKVPLDRLNDEYRYKDV